MTMETVMNFEQLETILMQARKSSSVTVCHDRIDEALAWIRSEDAPTIVPVGHEPGTPEKSVPISNDQLCSNEQQRLVSEVEK